MKTVSELVSYFVGRLEGAGADYLVVGAVAYFAYGTPRATKDLDLVIATDAATLDGLLCDLPPELSLDPQARMELFTDTMRWVIDVRETELKVGLFLLGDDPHHREEFLRRRRVAIAGAEVEAWIATAEDLVIQKLRWARRKDLDDARNILAVQGEAIDYAHLELWCRRHGTLDRLAELRASIPPGL